MKLIITITIALSVASCSLPPNETLLYDPRTGYTYHCSCSKGMLAIITPSKQCRCSDSLKKVKEFFDED